MPRARNQYIEEMRERFEVVNVAGRRVDRNFQASKEEKATLTGAEQVIHLPENFRKNLILFSRFYVTLKLLNVCLR